MILDGKWDGPIFHFCSCKKKKIMLQYFTVKNKAV